MKQTILRHRIRALLTLLLFCLFLASSAQVQAASKPAKITDCRLTSGSRVQITAKISKTGSVPGKKCYLFPLSLSRSTISSGMTPIQSKKKAKVMHFSFPLNKTKTSSRLYSHFVLAARRKNGTYKIISNSRYLSNPGASAKYTYKFPTAVSKKGLQVSGEMREDAAELNVRHALLNIALTDLIARESEYSPNLSVSYKYHGKTYWFRRSAVETYDMQLQTLKQSSAVVSGVLLLGWRDDLTHLIYPAGRKPGHAFYAWNTKDADAREQLQATIAFLASRYTASSAKYGRIVNWIVGNEVNNYNVYFYAGKKTLTQYAKIYADAFRLASNTVTSIYSNARVYISLDHCWNVNTVDGAFSARKTLDNFAKALSRQGSIPWNLAYHPYSSPLTEPKFWENKNGQLTQSALRTPVINMGNISVLSSYIRKKYGPSTRIILSEQGYTSVQNKKKVEQEQSAAIVYSYYLAEADDMIDSFIMNRHVDHRAEVNQGLNLGLWTNADTDFPEWADKKKDSWEVFKYMDTNFSPLVADKSLVIIGASGWKELIPEYSAELYSKTEIAAAPLLEVDGYEKTYSVASKWAKYGAASVLQKTSQFRRITHDERRNRNSLWGFSQSFKTKKLSFKTAPRFCTTLTVNGPSNGLAAVKLRFFSGKKILESSRIIPTGRPVKLSVSLAEWPYRKSVSKIQVLLAPAGGNWKSGADFTIENTVRAK